MKELIFATNNKHKLQEVQEMLAGVVNIHSLSEMGLEGDIPETADTLEGNALQKVEWVLEQLKSKGGDVRVDGVFADDTGLEVEALGGRPGVYSARYAGEHCSFDDNINKMLGEMEGKSNRRACFRTAICLVENGERRTENGERGTGNGERRTGNGERGTENGERRTEYFEGRVDGIILTERYGKEGFGYDPIFMPDRFAVSFAEMPLEVKNRISHRGRAVAKLVEHLKANS